jgi:hypothetical protein
MKVQGKITKINEVASGTSAATGKEWKKLSFLLETTEEYNNLYCFEVFGEEKVEQFAKFNRVGQDVDVDFNVKTNEWKGKYFTSLSAWKIFKADVTDAPEGLEVTGTEVKADESNDLPF